MARVSLILPVSAGCSPSEAKIERLRSGLESQGHAVEVVEVVHGRTGEDLDREAPWRVMESRWPGLANAAIEGIDEAGGDLLVFLDPARDHTAEDMGRLLHPLIADRADLAVATRARGTGVRGLAARRAGMITRLVFGTTAPRSGLIALTRRKAMEARSGYAPIGSLFALELLIKTAGRRLDVPIEYNARPGLSRFSLDEVRHLKRLADSRFGNGSRLVQFCMVGASGMVIDLTFYALFQLIFSRTMLSGLRTPLVGGPLDLAVAGALAIVLALTWNFSLNRRLTFSYARRGSLVRQYLTYALSNALGIGLSFSLRLILPTQVGFFNRHRLAAAVVGIVGATGISFSMSRWLVFSRRDGAREAAGHEAEPAEVVPLARNLPCSRMAAEVVLPSK